MASSDSIKIASLELAQPNDVMNGDAMVSRMVADFLRLVAMVRAEDGDPAGSLETFESAVMGLRVSINGSSVDVSPGMAVQKDQGSLVPVRGTYDSEARICFSREVVTVAAPAPVVDTWYIVEAQLDENITNESRPVLNEGTGIFTNTSVPKVAEFGLSITFRASADPGEVPQLLSSRVPLAYVFRPNGGGTIQSHHVWDCRRQLMDLNRNPQTSEFVMGNTRFMLTDGTEDVIMMADAEGPSGKGFPLSITTRTNRKFNLSLARYNGVANLVANTWYYVYLSEDNNGLAPKVVYRNAAASDIGGHSRGVLTVATTIPALNEGKAASGIVAPPGFNASGGQVLSATLVAIVRRNASNNGWVPMQAINNEFTVKPEAGTGTNQPGIALNANGLAAATTYSATINGLPFARKYRFRIRVEGTWAADTWVAVALFRTGGAGTVQADLLASVHDHVIGGVAGATEYTLEAPATDNSGGVSLYMVGGAAVTGAIRCYLIGYEL